MAMPGPPSARKMTTSNNKYLRISLSCWPFNPVSNASEPQTNSYNITTTKQSTSNTTANQLNSLLCQPYIDGNDVCIDMLVWNNTPIPNSMWPILRVIQPQNLVTQWLRAETFAIVKIYEKTIISFPKTRQGFTFDLYIVSKF